jgi:Autotransporter beta-domain
MTRCPGRLLHVGALTLAVLALGGRPSYGQSSTSATPPPTQDATLRFQLGLGNAVGCLPLLGIASTDPNAGDKLLTVLRNPNNGLGNELRAICGPSAVISSSALGGGMQSLQPVKTVTQFRLARSRIDQRLAAKSKPAPPRKDAAAAWIQSQPLNPTAGLGPRSGAGVFGEVEFAGRNRADTSYESGYESDVSSLSIGADYAGSGGGMVGGWFGRASQDGTFTRFSPVFATTGSENPQNAAVLNDPAVFTRVCGGLSTGGTLDQTANQFGGFAGYGSARGFVDGTFAWTHRDHEYARNVCTIETQGVVKYNSATGVLSDDAHAVVDDIYAGTLSGVSQIDETSFSFRGGADAGNAVVSGGPRVVFTVTRGTTGAYTETGRNTVANVVTYNSGDQITRTLGGPIGTELAFDEQTRTSMLLEAGGEFAAHARSVSPFFAAYWRHEFNDAYPVVTARMAQDHRTTPTVLSFGFDAYDRDAFQFGFGANAVAGDRFVVRVEYTRLVKDAIFSGGTFSVQARARF